jgi:nucleoside-diphosphate-sugar epimerase
MNILVTGHKGYIGAVIVPVLLQKGHAVCGLDCDWYNHDRPHRGVGNRTPYEAFLSFAVDLKNESLTV